MRRTTVLKWVGGTLLNHTVPCRISISRLRKSVGGSQLLRIQILLFALATLLSQPSYGDQLEELATKAGIRILSKGESSSDLQKKTVASIPLHAMAPASRQRAKKIMDDCSQYRRLPSLQYSIDEPMYRYLLQHPDVAVSTWRVMGISRFEMWQTGPLEYEAKAVDGSEGIADILYQDANQMVFVCEGTYHNALLPKPLAASALIWFRASYTPAADGTHTVSQKADVFVKFPSAAFSAVAKMLTPVTNGMMDRNLFEVSLYSSMMSRAVRDEPEWVIQVADQMEGVLPQRRGELIEVAQRPRKVNKGPNVPAEKVTAVDRSVIMSPQLLFFDPPKDGPVRDSSTPAKDVSHPGGKGVPVRTAELSKDVTPPKEQAKPSEK
jgi:hypothetical protein